MMDVSFFCPCLFFKPENIIIQIAKSSKETSLEPNVYHLQISEKRIYPMAYDFCQTILERECLQDQTKLVYLWQWLLLLSL